MSVKLPRIGWTNNNPPALNANNLNKMEQNVEDAINKIEENFSGNFIIKNGLQTNLNCDYYSNQLSYKKIGNIVFCYLIINTRQYTNNSEEDFYVEMPFTFSDNWYFPIVKSSAAKNYYLKPVTGSNKINLTKDVNRQLVKVKDVGTGYVIDTQFFAFINE